MTPTLAWHDFQVRTDDQRLLDLPRLDLDGPGLVLILGATGSGKTTLLRSATGALRAISGHEITGSFHVEPGRPAYLPQDAADAFISFDAENEFLLRYRALGLPRAEAAQRAQDHLRRLGLADRARHPLVRLSAGEQKRIALEAVHVGDPSVLLYDEPFNHLDAPWRSRIHERIRHDLARSLVLVTTHDPRPLLPEASRCLVLRQGHVAFDGSPQQLLVTRGLFPEIRLHDASLSPRRSTAITEPWVRLDGVDLDIEGRPLLRSANATFGPGLHVIVGDNGSGKTTLLRALFGFHTPTHGVIRVLGLDPAREGPAAMSRHAAFHFETPADAFFADTARNEVAFGPTNQRLAACDVTARTRQALFDFDLEAHAEQDPHTLSGGQQERLALASIAAMQPTILLLDEPTQGLDALARQALLDFLHHHAPHTCILLATHDAELTQQAHTIHTLADTRLVEAASGPLDALTSRLPEVVARIPS